MKYANLVERIAGERVDAWDIHYAAQAAQARGEDIIILSIGDPDFATPQTVTDAAITALKEGDTHYTEVAGRDNLREAIANWHQRQSGQMVSADHVFVAAGTQNGLFAAALCLCEAGDEVLVPEPMYLTYEASIRASGATLVPIPLDPEQGFRLDPKRLAAAVTPRTKAIFFATPCNPTGLVMRPEELQAIADVAQQHDLWVVADEVYGGLTFEHAHQSIAAFPGMAERTVTISSLSKSHAMAGWRLGWVVAPPALIEHLQNLALCMLYGLPGFIQAAGVSAIEQYDTVVLAMRDIYRRRRDLALSILQPIASLRCIPPEAGMFMLLDVSGTGLTATDFAWQLLHATGVSVLDGGAFGASARNFIRLGFVVDEPKLLDACQRIAQFVASLNHRVNLLLAETA